MIDTSKHATDSCPRCGNLFTCGVNSVLKCDCMWLDLSPADLAYIREYTELTFGEYTCLCVSCLRDLQAERIQSVS
ncbi:cysteine-rich CWC family protein [Fibrella forsythiae]|uniref:Cysteine-rich CWC family protein n=1 Tax=Fibrella forsythiae TaxID=2817061 RepID=A0ABS3JBS0_9BACT|nr:cysteine-rich CWC family protein [Fibrella forsythiae]MBO0947436.1 cysteine-rich CWC family protein [Fibrella forsythiae]